MIANMSTRTVYLDYAATTPLLPAAREAMLDGFAIWANPSSPHAPGRAARAALEAARRGLVRARRYCRSISALPGPLDHALRHPQDPACAVHHRVDWWHGVCTLLSAPCRRPARSASPVTAHARCARPLLPGRAGGLVADAGQRCLDAGPRGQTGGAVGGQLRDVVRGGDDEDVTTQPVDCKARPEPPPTT